MIPLLKDSPWTSFIWSALTMLVMVICVLMFSRTQLHEEVLDSDARFLKSIFEKNLESAYLENLEPRILSEDSGIFLNDLLEVVPLLNQTAITCLNIPYLQGIQAYGENRNSFNLSTSVSNSIPDQKDFTYAQQKGWFYQLQPEEYLTLLLPIIHEDKLLFIEFSLVRKPFEKSWREIDTALIKLGLLISSTMLLILWVIFWILIRKISAKENLLTERTEVLQKTNEELSRAYKTTSLGAMTGHLMHGLRGQLTNLKNLLSEDDNVQEQICKIQELVQQSLGSIKEVSDIGISYSLTIEELFEVAKRQFSLVSCEATFTIEPADCLGESVNNLQANLALAILSNLFQNSADALEGVNISLSCRKNKSFIEIDISDNGTGIPSETLAHLFEPVESKKKGGSGIGLALSRQLAESMEGNLQVIISNNRGTTFRLSIPIAT